MAIPRGSPMIEIIKIQATTIQAWPSQIPMKANQTSCSKQPGLRLVSTTTELVDMHLSFSQKNQW